MDNHLFGRKMAQVQPQTHTLDSRPKCFEASVSYRRDMYSFRTSKKASKGPLKKRVIFTLSAPIRTPLNI